MLKTLQQVRSEYTTKHGNILSQNTDCIFPDLIDFFGDTWKVDWKKQIFVSQKNIILTKN